MENKTNKILVAIIVILLIVIGIMAYALAESKTSIKNYSDENIKLTKEKEDISNELTEIRYKYETLVEETENK